MITISLCMIVRNEEQVLERCLKSVCGIADEIIIVDTGSTDTTKKIARRFTNKVFNFKWADDFSKARNFSFSKATGDYILWLDADDVITPENHKKLLELKKNLSTDTDIVMIGYDLGHNFQSTRERLFKREKNYQWQDPVHEYIPLVGNILQRSDIFITHKTDHKLNILSDRNIKIYQSVLKRDGTLSPRGKYYYARELKDHGRYKEAINYFTLFLDEGKGWKEDNISACFETAICFVRLGERNKSLDILLRSFRYDAPRAEICCMIGYYFKEKNDFETAAAWFETVLGLPKPARIGFVSKDYYDFIPLLELAVCYDKLQQYVKANDFNERVGQIRPDSKEYQINKQWFLTKI